MSLYKESEAVNAAVLKKTQQLVEVVLTTDSWCLKILPLFQQEFSLGFSSDHVEHCHLPGQLSSLNT